MKVLMTEQYLPDSIYTLELAKELKHYCDLTIFCRKDAGAWEEGITWIPGFYPGGENKVRAMVSYGSSLRKLAKLIRKGQFDVLHIQVFKNDKVEIPFYYAMRNYCKKVVFTVHNVLPHECKREDYKRYKRFYDFCDELLVHNQASKGYLMENFHVQENKITVIAHGAYDTYMPKGVIPGKTTGMGGEQSREPEKNPQGCNGTMTRFLQFGLIRRYKGIDILLEAVALIPPEIRKNLHFTIAGRQYSKLDATDYQKMIQDKGLTDCVCFLQKYISDGELPMLFEQTDFVVFPYRNIYGSGALLMAYTYNKPVIVSSIPAFLEETGEGRTGMIFESENPRDLAAVICQAAACSPGQIDGYRDAIRTLVSEKYNWKKSAAKTAEVYKK